MRPRRLILVPVRLKKEPWRVWRLVVHIRIALTRIRIRITVKSRIWIHNRIKDRSPIRIPDTGIFNT
jgi:hypothetical protein